MKDTFETFIKALKKNKKECPWAKEQEKEHYINYLTDEVQEIRQAIENNDIENLKEELGDALMDILFLTIIAEEEGHFTIKEVIKGVNTKLIRRKPWVFGSETISNKEEAVQRWNEIKALEKLERNKQPK